MARRSSPGSPTLAAVVKAGDPDTLYEAQCLSEVIEAGIPAPDDILSPLGDLAALWFTSQVANELLSRLLAYVRKHPPQRAANIEGIVNAIGPVLIGSQQLIEACVAANILPAAALDTITAAREATGEEVIGTPT